MAEEVLQLTAEDFEEAMKFLNLAFNGVDFPVILPKLYKAEDEKMGWNLAVKKDGRICAIVGLFPMTAHVGGMTLKVGGIGGVSTHPDFRGSGYMRLLMDAAMKEMQDQGYHLGCLGGLRQHYAYFNFEKCGTLLDYTILRYGVRHSSHLFADKAVQFRKLESNSCMELDSAAKLHASQPFYAVRKLEQFLDVLRSWNCIPWAALDDSGQFIGYLAANEKNNAISEVMAVSPESFGQMVRAWVIQMETDVKITLPPWAVEYARILGEFAESVAIQNAYNFNIIDWATVVGAFLGMKAGLASLCSGEAVIGIEGYGSIRIGVDNGKPFCERTGQEPDICLSKGEAARLIFGAMPSLYTSSVPDRLSALFTSWFPLPLSWLPQDGV